MLRIRRKHRQKSEIPNSRGSYAVGSGESAQATPRVKIHAGMPELIIRPCTGLVGTDVSRHVTRIYTSPEQMP